MTIYRITVQVTTDIECDERNEAVTAALLKVKNVIGAKALIEREVWVTGIACDPDGYMVFPREGSLPEPVGPTTVSIS